MLWSAGGRAARAPWRRSLDRNAGTATPASPARGGAGERGNALPTTSDGRAHQAPVVCIVVSGRGIRPQPTFSFVERFNFLKIVGREGATTSPCARGGGPRGG